jgi:hypothetical protein
MSVEINVTNEVVEINEVSEIVEINVTGGIGPAGAGVPAGGTTGQVLAKDTNDDYDTEWIDINAIPYVGATANVDLGEFELKAGQVEFDQTPTGTAGVGVMRWNDTDGTVDLGLKGGNVTLQVGQEQVLRVVNKTGADLLESQYRAVRIRLVSEGGAQGQRLAVVLAQGDNDPDSTTTIGIVTETITNNQEGFITTSGEVRGINTTGSLQGETWADGDILYLSPSVAGGITKVKPTAPDHSLQLGYVVYAHVNNGKIFVKVDNGYEIGELHDVYVPTPSNNDGIFWNTANLRYQNNSISGILGYTPQAALTLTTTGTSGAATLVGATLNIPQYSGTNIYNADGTLTGNRVVTMGSNTLSFEKDITVNGLLIGRKAIPSNIVIGNGLGSATGPNNIAIGSNALNSLIGSQGNIAIGQNALKLALSSYNTAIGDNAGAAVISGQGQNTFIGGYSGFNVSAGRNNICIGQDSGTGITTGSYNTIIGSAIGLTTTLSNNIILADGGGNIRIRAFNTGNVTIDSNTDAGYKLDVNGTARVSGALTFTGTYTPPVQISGIIGVGLYLNRQLTGSQIEATSFRDEIIANANGSTLVGVRITPTFTLGAFTGCVTTALQVSGGNTSLAGLTATTGNFSGSLLSGSATVNASLTGSLPEIVFNTSTGGSLFGAENSAANRMPDTIKNDIYLRFASSSVAFVLGAFASPKFKIMGTTGNLLLQDGGTFTDVASSRLTINSTTQGFLPPRMTTTERNAIATPATGLQVYNTTTNENNTYNGTAWVAAGGGMAIGGSITSATAGSVLFAGTSGVLAQDNANLFWDDTNDRLGIGTATPFGSLHLRKSLAELIIETSSGTGSANVSVSVNPTSGANAYFRQYGSSAAGTAWGLSLANSTLLFSNDSAYLLIGTLSAQNLVFGTANNERARITAAGRLLLGTTTESTYLLDVNGTARVSNATLINGDIITANAQGQKIVLTTTTNGTTRVAINSTAAGANFNTGLSIGNGTVSKWSLASYGTNADFVFYNDATGTNSIFIGGTTNNVVIGSSSDLGYKFAVNGTSYFTGNALMNSALFIDGFTNPTTSYISLRSGTAPSVSGGVGFTAKNHADSNADGLGIWGMDGISFQTAITERARITASGNFLIGTTTENTSALLEVTSTTKGFLPPRMTTTQKNAIGTPAAGLIVYDTDTNKLCCYNGTTWNDLF